MKKKIVVDPKKPLPPELSKEWEETFAKLILEHYFPDKFKDLSVEGEKPDLRNDGLDIGIEVTNAEERESRELDSLYSRQYTYGNEKEKAKALSQINKLGGSAKEFFLMHPVRHRDISKLYKSAIAKTRKLNTHYKVFGQNYLFLFDTILIRKEELADILKEFKNQTAQYELTFNEIFLYCFGGNLFEFNLESNACHVIDDSSDIPQELSIKARKMIDDKYQQ